MSSMDFVYELDLKGDWQDTLNRLARDVQGEIAKALDDIALAIEAEAKGQAGFKTGNLRRNIMRDRAKIDAGGAITAQVGVARTAPYGLWHHEGTGIFGKHRRRIRPTAGNVLVWIGPGGRKMFARSVKGQRANPFMRDAFTAVRTGYADARMRKLAHDIGNLGR